MVDVIRMRKIIGKKVSGTGKKVTTCSYTWYNLKKYRVYTDTKTFSFPVNFIQTKGWRVFL